MKELRYFYNPAAASGVLPQEEADHAVKVLRLKAGDPLLVVDGKGRLYEAEIAEAGRKTCTYSVLGIQDIPQTWQGSIHIAMAPTKNMDRTEWFAEKATEVGVNEITFLNCSFSERTAIKTERVERVVVAAMKQSHKAQKPVVNAMTGFAEFIARPFCGSRYIAHCYAEPELCPQGKPHLQSALRQSATGDILVMIGPEGDFSTDEVRAAIAAGFTPISLGESRLRTETAALTATIIANLNNSKIPNNPQQWNYSNSYIRTLPAPKPHR